MLSSAAEMLLFAFRDLWKEMGVTPIFRYLQNCQFHHRRLESLGHLNVLYIYIYIYHFEHYGLSFLDLTDAIFFYKFSHFCMLCVMYLTSI